MHFTTPTSHHISFAVIAVVCMMAQSLRAQSVGNGGDVGSASLVGRVIDAVDGRPLAAASIGVVPLGGGDLRGVVAGGNGGWSIEHLNVGEYRLVCRYVGYVPFVDTIRVAHRHSEIMIEMRQDLRPTPVEIIGSSPNTRRSLGGTASALSSRQIEQIAPIGTQELLSHIPGVLGVADDGIGNSRINIGIRGLNPRRSSRVLVMEDGIPVAPGPYIYPNMYYNPPSERIERVEVIKGSAAIRFGPQTMGGVINYLTGRPRSRPSGRTTLTAGTNGFAAIFAEYGGFGDEVLQPQIQLLYKRGDGFRQNNSFEQINGTFKLQYLPDGESHLYLKGNIDYENSNATYTGLTEYSFATDPTFNPKRFDNFRVMRAAFDALYTNQISDGLLSTTRGYISVLDRDWWRETDVFVRAADFDGATIEPVPYFQSGDLIRIGNGRTNQGILRRFYTIGVEQAWSWDHTLASEITGSLDIGGRIHFERFLNESRMGDAPDARIGRLYMVDTADSDAITILGIAQTYQTTALALHAVERVDMGNLSLTPGVRVEIFEQEKIDRLNGNIYQDRTTVVVLPGIGINYRIGAVNLFGGIHRGYTPPSDGTLNLAGFGEERSDGGLDVKAETSWNIELGGRGSSGIGSFELAGFMLDIHDMLAAYRGAAFENLGRVRTMGVEFAGVLHGGAFLDILPDLNIVYTFLQAEVVQASIKSAVIAGDVLVDISGNRLPYTPRHTVVAGLSMNLPIGLSWRFDWNYADRVYTDLENIERIYNRGDTGPIESHSTFDASLFYDLTNKLRVGVIGKNITDEIYIGSRLHSSPRQPEAHISSGILPGPRRQLNLQVLWRFVGE